jgi:hypothetical protein
MVGDVCEQNRYSSCSSDGMNLAVVERTTDQTGMPIVMTNERNNYEARRSRKKFRNGCEFLRSFADSMSVM